MSYYIPCFRRAYNNLTLVQPYAIPYKDIGNQYHVHVKSKCCTISLIGSCRIIKSIFWKQIKYLKPSLWSPEELARTGFSLSLLSCSVTMPTLVSKFLQSKPLFTMSSNMASLRCLSKVLLLMPCLKKVFLA